MCPFGLTSTPRRTDGRISKGSFFPSSKRIRSTSDVPVDALSDRTDSLRDQGFDAAAIVMLGGPGAGSADCPGFWARFVMLEKVGVWAMELTHALAGYGDLYANPRGPVTDHLAVFDNMACDCGTHPSAFTKRALGWLDPAAVTQHKGRRSVYGLHTVGLVQPPPEGRSTAVQVGDDGNSFMVEARQMVDPFDAGIARKNGKGGEGVIVYEVETPDINRDASCVSPLIHLKTPAALAPGTTFASGTGLIVQVISALPGGYSVIIDDTTLPWSSVSEGSSTPGAPVSAVVTDEDRVPLFLADPNGGIYTTTKFQLHQGDFDSGS